MDDACGLLLLRFGWPDADSAAALRGALAHHAGPRRPQLLRALQDDLGYAYVAAAPEDAAALQQRLHDALADALPTLSSVRLEPLLEVPGASAGDAAPFHYIVETDVLPEHEADLNAWYDTEHLPGLAAVPGTVRAARYRSLDGAPRYLACYDLARLEAFGSAPWLAVRSTAWSARVRPTFRNTRRTMFRRVG